MLCLLIRTIGMTTERTLTEELIKKFKTDFHHDAGPLQVCIHFCKMQIMPNKRVTP